MSNLILLNKGGVYSILDTKNGNIVNTEYKDLKVADIIEDGEKDTVFWKWIKIKIGT